MLFVMDANGTPSVAKTILITSDEKALEENECEHGFLRIMWESWKPTLTWQLLLG
jgi:hypothetical protein